MKLFGSLLNLSSPQGTESEPDASAAVSAKVVEELREVIRFQRGRVQIAETEREQSKLEGQRLIQRYVDVNI